jgi:hypothetical protein
MPKTPDEIKKGLECCAASYADCHKECPYKPDCDGSQILKDALALVQQLESRVPRWISVEERLPSEHISVAVYIDEGAGRYWIQTAYLNGGKWRIPGEFVVDRNITHWMPLPEPPEEE